MVAPREDDGGWTEYRRGFDRLADHIDEWQGVPVPIDGMPVTLHDRHPMADAFRQIDGVELQIIVGGPTVSGDEEEVLRNHWYSRQRNADVYLFQKGEKFFPVVIRRSPDGSMDRLNMWLTTLGASMAWDMDAEYRAREKLRGLLTAHQWRHYDLTGTFLESSDRSRLTYLFRRSRPTVVMTPRNRRGLDEMFCLAVLCLHPIGYYQKTWAGCMTPSDDVIAHLLFIRGDEAGFWKAAYQHKPAQAEAGL